MMISAFDDSNILSVQLSRTITGDRALHAVTNTRTTTTCEEAHKKTSSASHSRSSYSPSIHNLSPSHFWTKSCSKALIRTALKQSISCRQASTPPLKKLSDNSPEEEDEAENNVAYNDGDEGG
jgi:hypothetical protein